MASPIIGRRMRWAGQIVKSDKEKKKVNNDRLDIIGFESDVPFEEHGNAALTLFELNNLVAETIALELSGEYWVEAELSEAREVRGHCYMELIQKDSTSTTPIARASAKCWKNRWMLIGPHFQRVTGQQLHPGMKVMLKVKANFHEAFGFAWIVTDINPEYTMGDMARRRQEIIRQLKAEGVFDMQRELLLPPFAQRIAVISSASAAGYGDFCNQLADNDYGFRFQTRLFPAVMQGEQVSQSIIEALDDVNRSIEDFDCVVIIRGGGATADLSGFDTLLLAENVAQFPLPVITGIGHDRDESIIDMVSHTSVKTPTAAAAFLIDHLSQVLKRIERVRQRIYELTLRCIDNEQLRLSRLSEKIPVLYALLKTRSTIRLQQLQQRIPLAVSKQTSWHQRHLDNLEQRLPLLITQRLTAARHRLDILQQRTEALSPERLLRRGYSITMLNGKAVTAATQVKPGDIIVTHLADGIVTSEVKSSNS